MAEKQQPEVLVVLGTGGTIAGLSGAAGDNVGYAAGQVAVASLVQGAQAAIGDHWKIESEQVAQIDSKDMELGVWRSLRARCRNHLSRPEVAAVIVTHGTDTLEETAYFLWRSLPAALIDAKPLVLTGAMRPASSQAADGPQNLRDAMALAVDSESRGVLVSFAGQVHSALSVRKTHSYRLDAFDSGERGPLGWIEEGQVRWSRPAQVDHPAGRDLSDRAFEQAAWPRVELVHSLACSDGAIVDALLAQRVHAGRPLAGIVVAGTGNGTVHQALEAALARASQAGVVVLRTTRCADGPVLLRSDDRFPAASGLSPVKARIELMLELLPVAA